MASFVRVLGNEKMTHFILDVNPGELWLFVFLNQQTVLYNVAQTIAGSGR